MTTTVFMLHKNSEQNKQSLINYDLIKCANCYNEIQLHEKSIRKNASWFHEKCLQRKEQKIEI
jgi:hypothetical protein